MQENKLPESNSDLSALADQLAAHPDYRVLRRLPPQIPEFRADMFPSAQIGLALDTETTGKADGDPLVELGLVAFVFDSSTGEVLGMLDSYCGLEDPGVPMHPDASAVNGITDEMLRGKRLDDEKVLALLDLCTLVVAHNCDFDRPRVEARFPQFAGVPWVCSMKEVPWQAAGMLTRKLEVLGLELGFFFEAHRADADCHALLQVLNQPLAGLENQRGMQLLLEALPKKTHRLWAEGSPFGAKDLLRERGYRWSAGDVPNTYKAWYIDLPGAAELTEELKWLEKSVFRRSFSAPVTVYDANVRFSTREGERSVVYSS